MKNKSGSGDLLLLLIVVCCITLVVFWVVRSRKRRSTILEIQKSVTESSANGITNLSLVMAMVIIVSIAFSALVSNHNFKLVLYNEVNQLLKLLRCSVVQYYLS